MGLHRLSPAEGMATFLSSAALAQVAMARAPPRFRPFVGPAWASLHQEWGALQRHLGREDSQGIAVDDVCITAALPNVQKDTARATALFSLCSLTAHHDEGGATATCTAAQCTFEYFCIQSLLHLADSVADLQCLHPQQKCVLYSLQVVAGHGSSANAGTECALRLRCTGGSAPGSHDLSFFQHSQKCPQLPTTRTVCHNILCAG